MKTLVLCGPESSGKSWLSGEIQAHFGGVVVGEYVRHFMEREQRDTCYADIPSIARGQLQWEDLGRLQAPPLLILDTHLLSNILWSRALFGDCPAWVEQALDARSYDLHLLLRPEGVDWSWRRPALPAPPGRAPAVLPGQPALAANPPAAVPGHRRRLASAQRGSAAAVARLLDGQLPACATEC